MPEGHFIFFAGLSSNIATVESLVTDVQYTALIRFPINAQCSKGTHYFHRVVGLVVNICQCSQPLITSHYHYI